MFRAILAHGPAMCDIFSAGDGACAVWSRWTCFPARQMLRSSRCWTRKAGRGLNGVDCGGVKWAVTSAEPLLRAAERFQWRRRMGWGPPFVPYGRQQRYDPGSVLDGAQSVLTVAVPYWHPAGRRGPAVTSRSSWGQDYHDVVPAVVRRVLTCVAGEEAAARAHVQSDSGPLEERALALRAGLGYLGYNGSVYVPPYGSWVFLGVAVTDAVIGATGSLKQIQDPPASCLTCSRCVRACPTGALFAPYRINPHRCLSYLTQKRGFLAVSLRRAFQGRLFGCDCCQEVCPANAGVEKGVSAFAPDDLDLRPDPLSLLQMSEAEFRATWEAKTAGWRGRRTLRRNAIIALANTGGTEHIWALADQLRDASPIVRGHAAWAVGEIVARAGEILPPELRITLKDMSVCDEDPRVRVEAKRAITDGFSDG